MKDEVGGADEHRRNAATREALLVASAGACPIALDPEPCRGVADPALQVRRFIRHEERVGAAADHVEVQHGDEAFDPARGDRGLRDVRLGAEVALFFPGERREHDRVTQRRATRGERPRDLDGDGGPRRVVVRRLEDRPVGVGAHTVEVTADEDRALRIVGVRRAQKTDDVDRVDVVHRRERHGHAHRGGHVEPRCGRVRIGATRAHEILCGRDRSPGGREQLVRDFLADHERRHGLALQPRYVRVAECRAADDQYADRSFLVGVLDGAAAVRRRRSGDERDLPARVRAGEVVQPAAARGATHRGDLRLGFARARPPADALREINARPVGLPAGTGERGHLGEVDDRHGEVLEERPVIAQGLEPDLAKPVSDIGRGVAVPGGTRVAPAACRVGEVVDVCLRLRRVELGRGRDDDRGAGRRGRDRTR